MKPAWLGRMRYRRTEPRLEPGLYLLPLVILAIGAATLIWAWGGGR